MSERAYLDLLRKVRYGGDHREDRTGVGTYSLFGEQLRFDLAQGFPLLTTKKVWFDGVVYELLWFLGMRDQWRDSLTTEWLTKRGVHIWDAWAKEDGSVGPIYGAQWRSWYVRQYEHSGTWVDQIAGVIEEIKTNPNSRRLVVSAWNVEDLPQMALPPCHVLFQFSVRNGALSCSMYQRSADIFLGLPFNIASYALLTHMVAGVTGLSVGELVISLGDVHLYQNHIEQADTQLSRMPLRAPALLLRPRGRIDDFVFEDVGVDKYKSWPAIPAPIAV